MAAVLCNGFKNCCDLLGETIGKICTFPCKCMGAICDPIGDALKKVFCSPFSCYLITALVFNFPPIVYLLSIMSDAGNGCSAIKWLSINSFFCAANIACAFYVAMIVSDPEAGKQSDTMPQSAFERAKYLACYDPKMAVFIIIRAGFIIWLFMGMGQSVSGSIYENCAVDASSAIGTSVALGFGYLLLGFSFLMCSLCMANRGATYDPKRFAQDYVQQRITVPQGQDQPSQKHEEPYVMVEDPQNKQSQSGGNNSGNNSGNNQHLPYMVIW